MNKKLLVLSLMGTMLIIAVGAIFFRANDNPELTDEEIRLSLRCERFTADYLLTDYYCSNLDDYRRDLKNDDLLDNDWPYDFGQQQLKLRGYTD